MSHRKKIARFQELDRLPNVLQKPVTMAGRWQERFAARQPLIVELGCGYGEYTVVLAQRYPRRNYIGIDIQGERIWRGAHASLKLQLNNVQWLRAPIDQLDQYFAPGEIAELWLTFPDPFPKDRQAKKRLTAPRFLQMYRELLVPGGRLHIKTDAAALIAYTTMTVGQAGGQIDAVLADIAPNETRYDLDITTRFEQKHRTAHEPIYYLAWHWPEKK